MGRVCNKEIASYDTLAISSIDLSTSVSSQSFVNDRVQFQNIEKSTTVETFGFEYVANAS